MAGSSTTPFLFTLFPGERNVFTHRERKQRLRQNFEACRMLIAGHSTFVLTTHMNPDADGLGSELAFASYLLSQGKTVHILNHSATPPNCLFMDPHSRIQQFDPAHDAHLLKEAGIIVILDANQPDRLASLKPFVLQSSAKKICIDHHLDREEFADLFIIDEEAAATGEILFNLLTFLTPQPLSQEIATCLYTAIMTDSGSFRFPKTDGELHRIVAELLDRGADPVTSYQQHYEQESLGSLHLLSRALESMTLTYGGTIASMVITRRDFLETGTTELDTHSFITKALNIGGVMIGLLLTEVDDGVKISFRSKGDIPINKLAQEFGGNGHKNAAGARLPGEMLDNILPILLERAHQFIPS